MDYKEELLNKIYQDNTICYRVNFQGIWIRNQENQHIAHWYLNSKDFWLSYNRIWQDFKSKTNTNHQETKDLISSILEDHLKRKGLTTSSGFL